MRDRRVRNRGIKCKCGGVGVCFRCGKYRKVQKLPWKLSCLNMLLCYERGMIEEGEEKLV